jgi:hypothetical protein
LAECARPVVKREAFGHAKFKLVARDLRVPMFGVYGLLESIWNTTAVRFPRGDIGRLTDEEIAAEVDGLEVFEITGERLVAVLVSRRLLDRHPEHRLIVHDWPEHADSHVHAHLAKRTWLFADGSKPRLPHDRFNAAARVRIKAEFEAQSQRASRTSPGPARDASGTRPGRVPAMPVPVPVPVPTTEVPEQGAKKDTPARGECEGAPLASLAGRRSRSKSKPPLAEGFEEFYRAYPRHEARAGAEKAWNKLRPSVELRALILARIKRALNTGEWDLDRIGFIPLPATFLNGRRWEDEIRQASGAATGPPKGTKEWRECPTCREAITRVIGEPEPSHHCRAEGAAG